MPEPTSFDNLRIWGGSQSRAFEELSYQLLKNEVPAGARAVRTGNPDGGVEWYAAVGPNQEWGWQAKYIKGIDALLTAMTDSVKRVANERLNLTRLTFVISTNLSTGTEGRQRKSQRQKYDDKVASWKRTIKGAGRIEFDIIQESDLLDRLSSPEHAGRRWFWWNTPVLGADWLRERLDEQADAAGERYRPDLQVDLPIEEDLEALGFDQSIVDEYERLRRRVMADGHGLVVRPSGPKDLSKLHRSIQTTAGALTTFCESAMLSPRDAGSTLQGLSKVLRAFLDAVEAAATVERDLRWKWEQLAKDGPDRQAAKPPEEALGYRLNEMRRSASELSSWLQSTGGAALGSRFYFLVGPAGSGKTHLFLDAAAKALGNDRPAVVLFGARFGRGNLWESICDQLGLEPVGANVLLGAMDAAAEASGLTGRRFVVLVDALNETTPPDFWVSHLPALRAAIRRWPHVALAASCRETYLDLVDDGDERKNYVERTHPGFRGRETEATQTYFAHYGLEAPRIPLLVPEFTTPLFLRLYCESLRDADPPVAPTGHEGRITIFERYLEAKIRRVARQVGSSAASTYELQHATTRIRAVLDALLDEFATSGREGTTTSRAEQVATDAMGSSVEDAIRVLGALQNEGVLSRERLYLGSGVSEDGLRVAFQAFADFLLLRRRLDKSSDPLVDDAFRTWLADEASWGIQEAAAVVLPELHHTELPDYLGIDPKAVQRHERNDNWEKVNRARAVYRSVIETLPYRDSQAVTDRTIGVLNEAMPHVSSEELFRTLFQLAPQPGNRLNAEALHRYLLQFKMPRRDAFFGFATYHEVPSDGTSASTLARWAAAGPYPSYDPRVVELASIPLMWLMSSPNRFMRDWVTKALVQLLRGHLDVMRALLDRFWPIDDPYVVQRVVVIAYGALMRSDPALASDAKKLCRRVQQLVYTPPVRADELLLDAARGIIEFGVHERHLPKRALKEAQRPLGLAPPGNPPTEATLEQKYGLKERQPDNESYSSIRFSMMSLGDFGRYVVESGMHHFTRYRIGEVVPEAEPRERRFFTTRWKRFLKKLDEAQLADLGTLANDDAAPDFIELLRSRFLSSLSSEQHDLFSSCWERPKRSVRDDDYPADRARRWVFRRTLSLGWTPQLFGQQDRYIGHGRGREGHKAERWGKKYEWMAYHELLARVADNYQPARWHDRPVYGGLHEIIAEREIDPSLPPVPFRDFEESQGEGVSSWRSSPATFAAWPPARLSFSQYHDDVKRFINDRSSEPDLDKVTMLTDTSGRRWVALDAYWQQKDPEVDRWYGLDQTTALDTWFASAAEGVDLLQHLSQIRRRDSMGLIDTHGHVDCCYFGEVGWTPRSCYHEHGDLAPLEHDDLSWRIVPAVETYTWEGSLYDCSIGESAMASCPSTFVRHRAAIHWEDDGPSWRSPEGDLIFTQVGTGPHMSKALLVSAPWLAQFLSEHDLVLMVSSWCERRKLDRDDRKHHGWEDSYRSALIDSDLRIHLGETIREQR